MGNEITVTAHDSTWELARRVRIYRIPFHEIGDKCKPRTPGATVQRVLSGRFCTEELKQRVIPVAAKAVQQFERKHKISVGG